MALYHVAVTTPAAAAGAALFDIRTGANDRARVLEVGVFATTALAVVPSLERSTTLGTASTTVIAQAGDPADAATTVLIGTAWSVAPASTSVSMRWAHLPGNIGAGIIWTFGYGDMVLPVSASIVCMNRAAAAAPVCRAYITLRE